MTDEIEFTYDELTAIAHLFYCRAYADHPLTQKILAEANARKIPYHNLVHAGTGERSHPEKGGVSMNTTETDIPEEAW